MNHWIIHQVVIINFQYVRCPLPEPLPRYSIRTVPLQRWKTLYELSHYPSSPAVCRPNVSHQTNCNTHTAKTAVYNVCNKCKKLTSLKLIVRTMWWYLTTKTAKIFWVTLDGATHGASISCQCIPTSRVTQKIFAVLVEWCYHVVLTVSFKLVSYLNLYLLFYYIP